MIIGNAIYLGGTPLPELTNPAVAADIRYGKQSVDGDGEVLTGTIPDYEGETDTGTVIPVDTGANGLYKAMIEGNVTEIVDDSLTTLRDYAQYNNASLLKVSLPNLVSLGPYAFEECTALTGIIDLSSVQSYSRAPFPRGLRKTVKILWHGNGAFNETKCEHGWLPLNATMEGNYQLYGSGHTYRSIQLDNVDTLSLTLSNGQNNNFRALIIRRTTMTVLSAAGALNHSSNFHIYVPDSLVNDYKTATNWTTYAQYFVGIDEDTTCAVGQAFTPTYTAMDIVSWDQVDLQSYSVGTVDTATGAITPTHDGRLLIRGLDANDEIVHVTYLQIGTGFDEEANLAD